MGQYGVSGVYCARDTGKRPGVPAFNPIVIVLWGVLATALVVGGAIFLVMRRQWGEAVEAGRTQPKGLDDILTLLQSGVSDDERDSFYDYGAEEAEATAGVGL